MCDMVAIVNIVRIIVLYFIYGFVQYCYKAIYIYLVYLREMATDDPRLNLLIKEGNDGEIVIVGCPYDFLRKRSSNKGGEDNGPCCLRRFYAKVGPLINAQYQIDITPLKVTDMGNVCVQISKEEQQQQFKNVSSRRFKGQFVNYYKHSPQFIMDKISDTILTLMKNNSLPFVFGGSKQGLMASVKAFQQLNKDKQKVVYILGGKPFLERPFDGNKATSDNVCAILSKEYPQTKFTVFGPQIKYFPTEYVRVKQNGVQQINYQKLKNVKFVKYQQIRKFEIQKQKRKLGYRTQALHKFINIFNSSQPSQVHVSLEVLQTFTGCRDVLVEGLQFDEFTQIMMFLGKQPKLRTVTINQFNPSCQDYQSSLIILNAFYYFLLGRADSKLQHK